MKWIRIQDESKWRVENAREMGMIVGENCRFFSLMVLSEPFLVEIGDNVIVSTDVIFLTHDGGVFLFLDEVPNLRGHYGRIKIGNNCFIGSGSIILPNVAIGNNCIVGPGAVVMQSVPDGSVIMGNPAKVIFKTELYKKMKLNSVYTIKNDQYPFPTIMPEEMRKRLLLEHFRSLPLKRTKA